MQSADFTPLHGITPPTSYDPETPKQSLDLSFLVCVLRTRLVVARPKSTKEARGLISEIVRDNKRSHTNSLKAELRSIKQGDQSMESYFQKVDSLINILTSLEAHVNDEDVVHYVLDGLPDTYNHVVAICIGRILFPISKRCGLC
ncbi:hybrid signal transduction histidine kinase M [Tanacetum coccineum]